MRNDAIREALDCLLSYGIRPSIVHGTKHEKISWQVGNRRRTLTVSRSASDHRVNKNNRALIRKMMAEDGKALA